jgi:acetoin:2,6-dichlorophenolindophenol oxidoreductase subunit beta
MASLRYLQALAKALRDEMTNDPRVFVLGEDVRESLRGVTSGLFKDFGPERVIDTPISEAAFTGFATGAALAGRRPVVEYQIPSLVYIAFEQIINQAQKFHLMTGGQASVPVTILVPASGARRGLAGQHSDDPYGYLIHAGVKTVLPATAYDAYGLFVAAIRDPDPVAVFAPASVLGRRDEVPDEPYVIPLGKGRVHRKGTDVTVVAVGHLVGEALDAANRLETEGISVEVYDPRTLLPFDLETFVESVNKTQRLVILDDSNPFAGFAAEVAAIAAEHCHSRLRGPVLRVGRQAVIVPFSLQLEDYVLPSKERLMEAVRSLMTDRALHA